MVWTAQLGKRSMSVLVVGSVAYDSVVTPAGSRQDALGGSAAFFSVAGSYFTDVSVVAVVGADFKPEHLALLTGRGVDVTGLERRPGKTFRWSGVYSAGDVNARQTLDTQLNVFADFSPRIRPDQQRAPFVFLANIDPELQRGVLDQMETRPRFVALDTMDYWIEGKSSSLKRVVENIDALFIDEGEARDIASEMNLVRCARHIREMGPRTVVIKRGEHGVTVFREDMVFSAPAFPLEDAVDPTGAGDSFAGGFIGYLAASGDMSAQGFRRAAVAGSVMGSFAVESFSLDRIGSLTRDDIDARFRAFTDLSQFAPLDDGESLLKI